MGQAGLTLQYRGQKTLNRQSVSDLRFQALHCMGAQKGVPASRIFSASSSISAPAEVFQIFEIQLPPPPRWYKPENVLI
jgi:hypothetical protein